MKFGTIENIKVIPDSNGLITTQDLVKPFPPLPLADNGDDLVKPYPPIGNGNVYVEGAIVDEQGTLLTSVLVRLVDNYSGSDLVTPFYTTTGYYDAWTDLGADAASIIFKAKGFNDQKHSFAELLNAPDVIMHKGNNIPGWAIIAVIGAVVLLSKKKKKKIGEFTNSDAMLIFLLIGGVIAFNVVMKILRSLGLGGDPTDNEQSDPRSCWKPTYWQQYAGQYTHTITEAEGRAYASTIQNAFHVYTDDYNAILSVFSALRTKAEVSFLAWVFNKQYQEDLLSFLTDGGGILPWDGLSYSHLQTILELVKKLPAY